MRETISVDSLLLSALIVYLGPLDETETNFFIS